MAEAVHELSISGMTCSGCTNRLMRVLQSNPEVIDAKLSFENDSGIIRTTDKLTTDKVIIMVNGAGFIASA